MDKFLKQEKKTYNHKVQTFTTAEFLEDAFPDLWNELESNLAVLGNWARSREEKDKEKYMTPAEQEDYQTRKEQKLPEDFFVITREMIHEKVKDLWKNRIIDITACRRSTAKKRLESIRDKTIKALETIVSLRIERMYWLSLREEQERLIYSPPKKKAAKAHIAEVKTAVKNASTMTCQRSTLLKPKPANGPKIEESNSVDELTKGLGQLTIRDKKKRGTKK